MGRVRVGKKTLKSVCFHYKSSVRAKAYAHWVRSEEAICSELKESRTGSKMELKSPANKMCVDHSKAWSTGGGRYTLTKAQRTE